MKVYESIFDALRTSVLEVVNAGGNVEEELGKRFADAGDALLKQLREDLPVAPEGADYLTLLRDRWEASAAAFDAVTSGACEALAGAGPSDESLLLVKAWVDLGDIATRALAAEQASPIMSDAEAAQAEKDGLLLVKLAPPEGEKGEDGGEAPSILLKAAVPEHLAEIVTAPADLANAGVGVATDLLALFGIGPEELAKAAPPFKKKKGPPPAAEEGEEDDAEEGDEGEEDEEGYEDEDAEEGDEDEGEEGAFEPEADEGDDLGDGDPLETVTRLGSMILVQVDAMRAAAGMGGPEVAQDGMEPAAAPGAPDAGGGLSAIDALGQHAAMVVVIADSLSRAMNGDAGEEAPPEPAAPQAPAMKAAPDGDLAKAADGEQPEVEAPEVKEALAKLADATAARQAAEAELAKLKAEVNELLAQPATPKAVLAPEALSKAAEMGHTPAGAEDLDAEARRLADLAKRDPEAASLALFKRAQQRPVVRLG